MNYVAWCRYIIAHEKPTRIALCNSDDEGAFKVYRLTRTHPGEHDGGCNEDEYSRSVCEGIYNDRVSDNLGLTEALRAIRSLVGGHAQESKQITAIIDEAIEEHAI